MCTNTSTFPLQWLLEAQLSLIVMTIGPSAESRLNHQSHEVPFCHTLNVLFIKLGCWVHVSRSWVTDYILDCLVCSVGVLVWVRCISSGVFLGDLRSLVRFVSFWKCERNRSKWNKKSRKQGLDGLGRIRRSTRSSLDSFLFTWGVFWEENWEGICACEVSSCIKCCGCVGVGVDCCSDITNMHTAGWFNISVGVCVCVCVHMHACTSYSAP